MNICIVTENGGPNRYAYACASCPMRYKTERLNKRKLENVYFG